VYRLVCLSVCILCFCFSYCICVVLLSAQWGGSSGIEAQSLGPLFLQCFDTVGWVFLPIKPVPDMTHNVFGGTLNLAQFNVYRLGSFGREHAPVKEKTKKDKERHKEKTGARDVKSPHGDVVLRSSFSWDSSQGEFQLILIIFIHHTMVANEKKRKKRKKTLTKS